MCSKTLVSVPRQQGASLEQSLAPAIAHSRRANAGLARHAPSGSVSAYGTPVRRYPQSPTSSSATKDLAPRCTAATPIQLVNETIARCTNNQRHRANFISRTDVQSNVCNGRKADRALTHHHAKVTESKRDNIGKDLGFTRSRSGRLFA